MVYVHVPFCRSFCTYCDFYSEIACKGRDTESFESYTEALCAEISRRKGDPGAVCDKLHDDLLFAVPLKMGVRIAVCAVPIAKMHGMAEKIEKAQETVSKRKKAYDEAIAELSDLLDKRDALRRDEIVKAIMKSGRKYEEILAFLDNADEEKQEDS